MLLFLHRRIQSISGSSDDDDVHPHIGRHQCSPLIVVFKFYIFERHDVGEHGVWFKLQFSQLGFTNKIVGQCQFSSSPDVSLGSASLINSTNWQMKMNLGSDHLPIFLDLQMYASINPIQHRSSINMKEANWDRYSREIEDKLSKRRLPTNCQKKIKDLACHNSFLKQHHITYALDDTDSTHSRFQQRYWKRDLETLPRPPCQI